MYDYYDQPSVMTAELPWEPEENTDEVSGHKHINGNQTLNSSSASAKAF